VSAVANAEKPTARVIRGALLTVLLMGVLGTLVELFLLDHYEEWWQFAPLVLLGIAAPLIALVAVHPVASTVRSLQGLMLLFVVTGALGVYQHYSGNVEFELEMYPARAGFELFWESMKGATPALAPASVSWLGLVGLTLCFRHPALTAPGDR